MPTVVRISVSIVQPALPYSEIQGLIDSAYQDTRRAVCIVESCSSRSSSDVAHFKAIEGQPVQRATSEVSTEPNTVCARVLTIYNRLRRPPLRVREVPALHFDGVKLSVPIVVIRAELDLEVVGCTALDPDRVAMHDSRPTGPTDSNGAWHMCPGGRDSDAIVCVTALVHVHKVGICLSFSAKEGNCKANRRHQSSVSHKDSPICVRLQSPAKCRPGRSQPSSNRG